MNERMDGLILNAPDEMLRMTVLGGQARVMMARTTRAAQAASDTHLASDAAAAAMGRVLPGTAMMSLMLKEEKGSVTLTLAGDGAGGKVTCVGRGGRLKITCDNPQAELETVGGRQDVPGFIGAKGRLTVVKDFGEGEPYVGTSELVSGGVAEDLARYFTVSEQTPTLLALGCLNQNGVVLSSGGVMAQALPGCGDEALNRLEMLIPFFSNISRELYDRTLDELSAFWFQDMDMRVLSRTPLSLSCDCSREKMERALLATGRSELESMLAANEPVGMTCWFCRTTREFTPEDLKTLLNRATRPHEETQC